MDSVKKEGVLDRKWENKVIVDVPIKPCLLNTV